MKPETKANLSTIVSFLIIGLLIWGALCLVSCATPQHGTSSCGINTTCNFSKGDAFR